jgi:hypothetical protein
MTTTRRRISRVAPLLVLVNVAACGSGIPPRSAALDPSNPYGAESPALSVSLAPADSPDATADHATHDGSSEHHTGHNHAASKTTSEASSSPADPAQAGNGDGSVLYGCPMHPEVKSAQPGTCPKCGMKLVPKGTDK